MNKTSKTTASSSKKTSISSGKPKTPRRKKPGAVSRLLTTELPLNFLFIYIVLAAMFTTLIFWSLNPVKF
ncbi:ABC transporter permease [Caenorhabditis elegans]|uniref:ABC transporter permease n=1 Tax=Caenorhabditis elegans TaxID=6239 RepID=E0AHA6_CAEEL|nr:ABC transporter permease [Caenorhabditis elegans]CCD72500.1 ABC transporter permease [Caenorhabditis elegans]|eukprot:NP_001256071.1 Uncharacterized protein CELE_ZC404.2 [Caenorhabditis elegans]